MISKALSGIPSIGGSFLSAVDTVSSAVPEAVSSLPDTATFPVVYALVPVLMFLGMALIAVGAARAKNAASTSLNQWVVFTLSVPAYIAFGHLFFEGRLPAPDWQSILQSGIATESDSGWSLLGFQAGIVAIALSIACRSMIDRIRLRGLIVFSILFSGIVFPVLAQWGWGSRFSASEHAAGAPGGWLEMWGTGFYDFAGAGVIHLVGGAFALAGAMIVGVRRGRRLGTGRLRHAPGHQPVLIAPGVMLALIGWCGFHLGFSSLAGASGGKVIVMTLLAAASSGLSAMMVYRVLNGATGFHTTFYGAMGGLVAASSCAASLSPLDALIMGAVAGVIVVLGTSVIERLGIDDAGGAIPAHLFCGFWGVVAVSLFGPAEMRGPEGLKTQLAGAGALGLSAFVIALVLFKLIDNISGLKVSGEDQLLGSDFNELSLNAYPDFEEPQDLR